MFESKDEWHGVFISKDECGVFISGDECGLVRS